MVGLTLEGGGAKGSYQAGAYLALRACHIKIDAVVGTSIGALNAALIAQGDYKKMISLWKDASMSELIGIDEDLAFKILNNPLTIKNLKKTFKALYPIFKDGGLDISPYRALIRNNIDEEKIRNSSMKYGLTTLKLDNLNPIEIYIDDIPEGKLSDFILASSYLPIFKKQKIIDNSYYIDGGFYNLSPTDMLEKIGCDVIFDINIKGIGIRKPRSKKSRAKIIEIKPNENLGSIIVFNKESIEKNMQRGYNDTLKVLKKLDGENYYFFKRSDGYYKSITKKGNKTLLKAIKDYFKVKTNKECIIKCLEHIMIREGFIDTEIYHPKKLIKTFKKLENKDSIYEYIKSL